MNVRELEALGVDLVAVDQAVDSTTPAGRLLFHVLGAIAEFERDLIRERVVAGLRRARAQGRRLGRPRRHEVDPARAVAMRGGVGRFVRLPGRSTFILGGVCREPGAQQRRRHPSEIHRNARRLIVA